MKIVVLYRPASEHGQTVEEYVREFTYRKPELSLDLVSLDTRDGAATATLYDVQSYPAILVLGEDGQVAKDWQGAQLPLMDEIAYYALG